MAGDTTQTLPLGTLVRGEKFARRFRLTDVPATVTPTWHWTRKKHLGEISLTKSSDTQWEILVTIDSSIFEADGEYTQNLVIKLGEEKRKITVSFAIAREAGVRQEPLIIDNVANRGPRMVTRRRMMLVTRFEAWTALFVLVFIVSTTLIGSSIGTSATLFLSNIAAAALDVGSDSVDIFYGEPSEAVTTETTEVQPTLVTEVAVQPTTIVETATSIPPTETPVITSTALPTAIPTSTAQTVCTDVRPTRLAIGQTGTVSIQGISALRLRNNPTINGETLRGMILDTAFIVLEGPVCADGYRWWRIQLTETSVEGWAAESDALTYFLAPN